jgi:selenocysteine-specific elongation factor
MYVVATAGHVDHGKSTLIRALTGMEPDRWAEERRRGMTIDLGFAWTDLSSGERIAFVDVPGHERFITNMLAGVGQVPAAMLVVGADEGWRQQTHEHFDALHAFGVGHLLVVVTRSDLAEPQRAVEQSRNLLDAAGYRDPQVVVVSGATGAGLAELRDALGALVAQLPVPDRDAPARLWVDRVFSIQGAGTVVTGTLVTGRLAVGDEVEIAPTGTRATIRRLESCKEEQREVSAVARVAVNLRGVAVESVARGNALIDPDSCVSAGVLDVELSTELPAGRRVLHLGSSTASARLRPLGAERSRFHRITVDSPIAVRLNDHGLLRDPNRQAAIAGVVVRDCQPPVFGRRGAAAARADELAKVHGVTTAADIVRWRGWTTVATLCSLGAAGPARRRVADVVISDDQWQVWLSRLAEVTAAAAPGELSRPHVRQTLELPNAEILDVLVAASAEVDSGPSGIRVRGGAGEPAPESSPALDDLERNLVGQPFSPPDGEQLVEMGLSGDDLAAAVRQGRLVRVAADIYLLPDFAERAVERLRDLPAQFTVSEARTALDSTRRVTLPLLQHLDAARWTERTDDLHRRLLR